MSFYVCIFVCVCVLFHLTVSKKFMCKSLPSRVGFNKGMGSYYKRYFVLYNKIQSLNLFTQISYIILRILKIKFYNTYNLYCVC